MTGQTLESLQKYPSERQVIFSKDERTETIIIQNDLNLLNSKKADIDKVNKFTDIQDFSAGFKNSSKLITDDYTLTAKDSFLKFDTTSNAILCTLPDASTVLDQTFKFYLKTQEGSNDVTIKTASGDTLNITGNNTILMDSIDDYLELIAVNTNRWIIKINNNCDLSTT